MRRPRFGIRGKVDARLMTTLLGPVSHVSTDERVAALTFDDGPDPESTSRVLQVLEQHRARATFFMVGKAAHRHPDLVRRVAQAGHAIGNHSWDHPSFPLLSGQERRKQIRACARVIAPYGSRLFRPPYGHLDYRSRLDILWLGYEVITWDIVGDDVSDRDSTWIAGRVIEEIQPGSIISLHDALYHAMEERFTDRTPLIEAVGMILDRLRGQFRFVTVPELLRGGQRQRHRWFGRVSVRYLNALQPTVGSPRRYPERGVSHAR